MKSKRFLLIPLLAMLLISADLPAAGTVNDYRFFSKSLNREMAGRIYLPEDYDPNNPDKQFPVIYFLHGASLAYNSESYSAIYPILDYLIAFRQIKPVILVLPDGLAPPYNGSFYTNSALYGNFEDYISTDLIQYIDSTFFTANVASRRGIMGVSMGAYGALKIAFRHQELFTGVVGHSGPTNTNMMDVFIPDLVKENGGTEPYHWSPGPGKGLTNLTYSMAGAFSPNLNNNYQVDFPLDSLAKPIPAVMVRWRNENICEIAKTFNPGSGLNIRFDCGSLDDYYLYYQNRSLADTLTKYNIPYRYDEYIGNHTSGLPLRVTLSFDYFDKLFLSTDIQEISIPDESSWIVYPNPASNTLMICLFKNSPLSQPPHFRLTNTNGQLVATQALRDGINLINTSKLESGLYFYSIQTGKSVQTGKTIIAR